MKKLLSLGVCAILSLSFEPALAQQNQGSNALPSIPGETRPTQPPAQRDVNSGNVSDQDMRKMINPLEIIKQQEQKKKESNKTNSWTSSLSDEEIIELNNEENNEENPVKQQSKAEILKSLQEEKDNKRSENTESGDSNTSETAKKENDKQNADKKLSSDVEQEADTETSENKIIGNNPDTQDNQPQPKAVDQKTKKKEAILKYQSAKKNIKKLQAPKRTWNLD